MIGITLIIFIRMDRSHRQSKWIGITLVNCYLKITWIVCYATVVYVMNMVYILHKCIIHMTSHGNKNQHTANR